MADTPLESINVYNEKHLHAALKAWLARPGDRFEVPVDGYVIDIVRGDRLIEIQTGNFAALKRKLHRLTRAHPVRLVYPIAAAKWIVKQQPDGTPVSRRKSPRRGAVVDLFQELVSIPRLIARDGFELEVVLIHEEEVRRPSATARNWRRGGWGTVERRLLTVEARLAFVDSADFRTLLPPDLPQPFTTADLARALGRPRPLAQKMTYCLRHMNVLTVAGKQQRSVLYLTAPA